MQWIKQVLEDQSKDDKIVWKASNMHHPMFGLHYDDYQSIIDDFKPLIADHGYDVFFNGHEHLQNYAVTSTSNKSTSEQKIYEDVPYDHDDCWSSREWFP